MIRSMTDDLLARAGAGDAEAFRLLVEPHIRRVFRSAYRWTGSEADAGDIAQEVFLTVFQRLGQLKDPSAFTTWVNTITRTCCLKWSRHRRRRRLSKQQTLEEVRDIDGHDGRDDELDLRELVRRAAETLPEIYRSAISLTFFQGLTATQAADVLGVPVGTIKSRVHTAIHELLPPRIADLKAGSGPMVERSAADMEDSK